MSGEPTKAYEGGSSMNLLALATAIFIGTYVGLIASIVYFEWKYGLGRASA